MAKIPKLKTEEEIREFWATHDSADYFEDMEDDEVEIRFHTKKNVLVLPIGKSRLKKVREIALKKGISSNEMMKKWIEEGIKREFHRKYGG